MICKFNRNQVYDYKYINVHCTGVKNKVSHKIVNLCIHCVHVGLPSINRTPVITHLELVHGRGWVGRYSVRLAALWCVITPLNTIKWMKNEK